MKWASRLFNMRGQKSMLMWCKHEYHEAFENYKLDSRAYPRDNGTIAADIARVQSWEAILFYLTNDKQWLE
jgi:hypothetical protein